jgi:hypothetical protein
VNFSFTFGVRDKPKISANKPAPPNRTMAAVITPITEIKTIIPMTRPLFMSKNVDI